jgi:hypothetical protein
VPAAAAVQSYRRFPFNGTELLTHPHIELAPLVAEFSATPSSASARWASLVFAVLTSLACSSGETHRDFSDFSGATFRRTCSDDDCNVKESEPSCGDRSTVVGGRWLSVCTGDTAFYSENCRLVRCAADSDCDFYSGYSCSSGRCEDLGFSGPGVGFAGDVFAWCLATTSRADVCRTASSPADSPLVSAVRAVCPRDRLGCDAFPQECSAP